MATQTRLPVIDADAHVIETERTWDYLEPSEKRFRPLLYASSQDPTCVGRRITVERPEHVGEVMLREPQHHGAFGRVPALRVRRMICAPELDSTVVAFHPRRI